MIRFTTIAVSYENSKPKLIGMQAEDITEVIDHFDTRDSRIKSRVTYKVSHYQTSIRYSTNRAKYILNQIDNHETRINTPKRKS